MKPELILIVLFLGCAAPAKRKKQGLNFCTIPLTTVFTQEDVANDLCFTFFTYRYVMMRTGKPLDKEKDKVIGCAGLSDNVLVAEYDKDTIMHEVRHFVNSNCPWLKEIR